MKINKCALFVTCLFVSHFSTASADPGFLFSGCTFKLTSTWVDLNDNINTSELGLGIYQIAFANIGAGCTGTLISPQGHVLTARHCVESTISIAETMRSSWAPQLTTPFETSKEGKVTSTSYNLPQIYNMLELPIKIDGQVTDATIFATGPGELDPRFPIGLKDPTAIKMHNEMTEKGYSDGGDFVVVQIPKLAGQRCYRLNLDPVSVGAPVKNIAFSELTQEHGTDWPKIENASVILSSSEKGSQLGSMYYPTGSFVTNGQGEHGNSGSAGLNAKNEIVGVLHTQLPVQLNGQMTSYTMYISTQRILALIGNKKGEQLLKLNKSCDR